MLYPPVGVAWRAAPDHNSNIFLYIKNIRVFNGAHPTKDEGNKKISAQKALIFNIPHINRLYLWFCFHTKV